jgi:predicted phosphoribosyltransferase
VTVSVSVSVSVLVAGVEAGTVLVGKMVKVQLVSSPPQGSVSVSVSVVETTEVPVGIVKVTRLGVEETSEVVVGSIVAVTRVTPMTVEEA